eukprot:5370929-Pyramimonas_sp.AAC.1
MKWLPGGISLRPSRLKRHTYGLWYRSGQSEEPKPGNTRASLRPIGPALRSPDRPQRHVWRQEPSRVIRRVPDATSSSLRGVARPPRRRRAPAGGSTTGWPSSARATLPAQTCATPDTANAGGYIRPDQGLKGWLHQAESSSPGCTRALVRARRHGEGTEAQVTKSDAKRAIFGYSRNERFGSVLCTPRTFDSSTSRISDR